MGASIHAYVEVVKKAPLGSEYCATVYICSNYTLFALLADVRNDGSVEPISEPKGLPTDVSPSVKYEAKKDRCFHTHSWLSLKELKKVQRKYAAIVGHKHYQLSGAIGMMVKLKKKHCKPRLVFWFDT